MSVRSGLLGLHRLFTFLLVALGVGLFALIPGAFVAIIWAMYVGGRPSSSTSSGDLVVDALIGLAWLVSLSLLTWVSVQLYRLTRVPEQKLRAWAWLAAGAFLAQLPLVVASADTLLQFAALPLRLAAGVGLALFLFQLAKTLRVSSSPRLGLALLLGPLIPLSHIIQSHVTASLYLVLLGISATAFLAGLLILLLDVRRLADALGPERSPGPGAPKRTILGA